VRGGPRGLSFPLAAARTPALTLAALVTGGLLAVIPATTGWWHPFLLGALVLLGAPVVLRTLRGVLRGILAADLVAMLAIGTAIALREPVAGLVIGGTPHRTPPTQALRPGAGRRGPGCGSSR
jgi:hypothetical protein